jgi:hypothetical protein
MQGEQQYVVMVDPPIAGVRHSVFGPYTEQEAWNFLTNADDYDIYEGHALRMEPLGRRIMHPLGQPEKRFSEPAYGSYTVATPGTYPLGG